MKAGKGYWWRVRIWDANNNETLWSEPAYFSLGPDSSQWKGKWITSEWKDKSPLPYFVRSLIFRKSMPNLFGL